MESLKKNFCNPSLIWRKYWNFVCKPHISTISLRQLLHWGSYLQCSMKITKCHAFCNSFAKFSLGYIFVTFCTKCTIVCKKIHTFFWTFTIICNSLFCKRVPPCTVWIMGLRWSTGRSASAVLQEMTWRQNWMSQHCLLQFFCLWLLYAFLDSNASGNIHALVHIQNKLPCHWWTLHTKK